MNTVELVEGPAGTELGPNKRVAGALFEVSLKLFTEMKDQICSLSITGISSRSITWCENRTVLFAYFSSLVICFEYGYQNEAWVSSLTEYEEWVSSFSSWPFRISVRWILSLLQIDMILTVAQASRIASGRRRRMLVARAAQRWPTTINYKFAETDGRLNIP